MLKNVFLSLSLLASFSSYACYYNLPAATCSPGYTYANATCTSSTHAPNRVEACVPNTVPINAENTCIFAYASSLEAYKVCPGGPIDNLTQAREIKQPACRKGSIIQVDNQVLGEEISLTGVPYKLTYSSQKVKGRKDWYKTKFPVTGAYLNNPSGQVTGEKIDINVAGQTFSTTLSPVANLTYTYTWDGLDGSGNPVLAPVVGSVEINEQYSFSTTNRI